VGGWVRYAHTPANPDNTGLVLLASTPESIKKYCKSFENNGLIDWKRFSKYAIRSVMGLKIENEKRNNRKDKTMKIERNNKDAKAAYTEPRTTSPTCWAFLNARWPKHPLKSIGDTPDIWRASEAAD
jgi:hypothetical protein